MEKDLNKDMRTEAGDHIIISRLNDVMSVAIWRHLSHMQAVFSLDEAKELIKLLDEVAKA